MYQTDGEEGMASSCEIVVEYLGVLGVRLHHSVGGRIARCRYCDVLPAGQGSVLVLAVLIVRGEWWHSG
jgi:hypothetical protein